MTSLARAALVTLAALALIAASGCGSDTKTSNDYVGAINKVQTDFVDNIKKVNAQPSGSDPLAAAKQTFAGLKSATDKVIADLKAVKPPGKVKDLHNELVSEMSDFDAQVKQVSDSLASGDTQKLVEAQTKFVSSASAIESRIGATIDAINKKLHS